MPIFHATVQTAEQDTLRGHKQNLEEVLCLCVNYLKESFLINIYFQYHNFRNNSYWEGGQLHVFPKLDRTHGLHNNSQ